MDLRLGDIVTVSVSAKAGKPHVVVGRPLNGRILLCYCGSKRWYLPMWVKVQHIITRWPDDGDERALLRCRRLLLAIKPSPDGWKRIDVGRYGCEHAPVIVGNVDVPWTWAQ